MQDITEDEMEQMRKFLTLREFLVRPYFKGKQTVSELSDQEVLSVIDRHLEGGIKGFIENL